MDANLFDAGRDSLLLITYRGLRYRSTLVCRRHRLLSMFGGAVALHWDRFMLLFARLHLFQGHELWELPSHVAPPRDAPHVSYTLQYHPPLPTSFRSDLDCAPSERRSVIESTVNGKSER